MRFSDFEKIEHPYGSGIMIPNPKYRPGKKGARERLRRMHKAKQERIDQDDKLLYYRFQRGKEFHKFKIEYVDYKTYMDSGEWKDLRDKILWRARGTCEACCIHSPSQVHHITYRNLGHERPWQLLAVCSLCHKIIHGIEVADD